MSPNVDVEGAVSDYREFPAPPALADHLLCLWTQSIVGTGAEYAHRVLPDLCVDIVLINDDAPVVVGPWTKPFIAHLCPGAIVIGARVHPGKTTDLLGLPASELLNESIRLDVVWGRKATEPFSRIGGEPSLSARRNCLADALLTRLPQVRGADTLMSTAIGWLARHPQGRVEELSRWIGLSGRQLQRRFTAAIGYGPKTFQSVLRFQRLLNLAKCRGGRQHLAAIAVEAGYADQAHMTREVERFAGARPSVLLGSAQCTLEMSDLFNTKRADFA